MAVCIRLVIYSCKLKEENSRLKAENEMLMQESEITEELQPCYICGSTVKIQPVNESFYIECENCGLETRFFKSKSELIKYWDKETASEPPEETK